MTGLPAETAQSALRVILKLVICGLISTILIVLGTVYLQFQSWSVPISLRPVLRTVASPITAAVWSSWSYFLHLVGVSVSVRQLARCGLEYHLALEEELQVFDFA